MALDKVDDRKISVLAVSVESGKETSKPQSIFEKPNRFLTYFRELGKKENESPVSISPFSTPEKTEKPKSIQLIAITADKPIDSSKEAEKRQRLEAYQANILNKQQRVTMLLGMFGMFLLASNSNSVSGGKDFIGKRVGILANLLAKLCDLADGVRQMLSSMSKKVIGFMLIIPADSPQGDAPASTEGQPEGTENTGNNGFIFALHSSGENGNDNAGGIPSGLTSAEPTPIDEREVEKYIEHSDKSFKTMEDCMKTHMQLLNKRNNILRQLATFEEQMMPKAMTNPWTMGKVMDVVQRVTQGIRTMDDLLEQSEPDLEAMSGHVVGALTAGAGLGSVATPNVEDVKGPNDDQQGALTNLVDKSHDRYDKHQDNLVRIDEALTLMDEYGRERDPEEAKTGKKNNNGNPFLVSYIRV